MSHINKEMTKLVRQMQADRVTVKFPMDYEEVMEDIQKQTLSELDDEIHENNLITWEHDSDGDRMNTDNLIEWLSLFYTIERK